MIFSGHTISCLGAIVQTERPEQDDPFSSGNLVEAFVMSLTDGRVWGGMDVIGARRCLTRFDDQPSSR
jgi:hypothetical protein